MVSPPIPCVRPEKYRHPQRIESATFPLNNLPAMITHSRIHPVSPRAAFVRLAALVALVPLSASAQSISYNTGSLGVAGDGVNSAGVVLDQPGALAAFGDYSSTYAAPDNTTVPFLSQLNPPAGSPFTIEFWARPTASDGDDAPVSNRLGGGGDRSGWVFFQRAAGIGWNFRMYNGNGGTNGVDITGGTSTLNAWSHVVVTWNGSAASLYVNGAPTNAPNIGAGGYNPNTTESFYLGALIGGGSPSTGSVDEVAFYPTALSAAQILDHYDTAASAEIGAYSSMVLADGALLYLQQNPPEVKFSVAGPTPTITFTGILEESTNLVDWDDLVVTSPYTPPTPLTGKRFFRSHR
jgi:hypothetical protein